MPITRAPQRHRLRLIASGAVLAAAAGTVVPTAAGASPALPDPLPASEVFLDVGAKAVLDWSVPERYAASWDAYDETTGYDPEFVNPRTWPIDLNACASTSIRRITSYTFTVAQVGTSWTQTFDTEACTAQLRTLPAMGLYRVSLVLHTDMGVAPGVSAPASRFADIRDYLIVSMGDSLASGEGNPDVPGSYVFRLNPSLDPVSVTVKREARWQDRRCHRSARSGPALAAKAYEHASRYTSVTFISVACSGAELQHLLRTRYAGMEDNGLPLLAPQVDAVSALVGPRSPRGGRRIDSLLISAGVNNLGFSDIIMACVLNNNLRNGHEDCVTGGGVADKIDELRREYALLALAIEGSLPGTREVYLNDYPTNVFRGGACGLLAGELPALGIDYVEGQEMQNLGTALAARITLAMRAHRQSFRWNQIDSLDIPFYSHSYCDKATWYRSLEESMGTQGNVQGTAHPNAAGHAAYAELIKRAMVPDQARDPYRKLTLRIDAVKAKAVSGATPFRVDPVLWEFQNDWTGRTQELSVPADGKWTPVPAAGTFTVDLFVLPSSPRHATKLQLTLAHILPIEHTRRDGYGVGSHEIQHPAGLLAVRYTVVAETPGTPGVG